jgi:hypothetical protein
LFAALEPAGARHHDEMFDARGGAKPHWETVTRILGAMPAEEYARRIASARRMIRENGVTYNVYDDEAGQARPWQLDIVPFVIAPPEWATIEAAVIQRARLADAILRDIYGPQRLSATAICRRTSCTAIRNSCARSRAQAAGRRACASLLGRSARDETAPGPCSPAAPMRRAVWAMRSKTASSSARRSPNCSASSACRTSRRLLSGISRRGSRALPHRQQVGIRRSADAGPYNEAYFEHAYLAHYLGLELVEGEDLAVRDGGLPAHAGRPRTRRGDLSPARFGFLRSARVARRLGARRAGPGRSAIRAGGVVLANALGGGVVESPALDAFLPAISRALFGEDLLISDVPTVWCGTAWGRQAAGASRARSRTQRFRCAAAVLAQFHSARSAAT